MTDPDASDNGAKDDRFRDFDEDVESQETIRFKMKGRDYEISSDPPVKRLLVLYRQGRLTEDDPDGGAMIEVLEVIVGKENLDQMYEDGVGIRQLGRLALWLKDQFSLGADEQKDGEEPDEGPQSASTRSSNNGRRSRQTSAAST